MAREHKHMPLTMCILDRGGHLVSTQREDGSSIFRFEIAFGKAWACLGLGHSTNFMEKVMLKNRPHFVDSLAATSGGKFVPALGGILIRDAPARSSARSGSQATPARTTRSPASKRSGMRLRAGPDVNAGSTP
jgi:uncharacterized protein GlcG (DUF336 family)